MDRFLIFRPDDQLLLGVSWSGLSLVEAPGSSSPLLEAGDDATLVLSTPPQHLAEQASAPGSAAPQQLPSAPGGEAVSVWSAALAGPSRVAFKLDPGTRVAPTAEGLLALLADHAVQPSSDPAGPHDTAIELPWRLAISPTSRQAGDAAVMRHPTRPVTGSSVTALWRTRIMARSSNDGDLRAAGLKVAVVDGPLAASADPPWAVASSPVPLNRADRTRVHLEAGRQPADVGRLELSPLGGTLTAAGAWPNFRWEHDAVLGRDMHVQTVANGVLFPLGHRAVYTKLTERVLDPDARDAAVLRTTSVLSVSDPVRLMPDDARARRAFPFDRAVLEQTTYVDIAQAAWKDYPLPGGAPAPTYFVPTGLNGKPLTFPVRLEVGSETHSVRLPLVFVADLRPSFDSVSDPGLAQTLASEYGAAAVPIPGATLDLVRSATPREGDRHEVQQLGVRGTLVDGGFWPNLATVTLALPALRELLGHDETHTFSYAEQYLERGDVANVLLNAAASIQLGFGAHAERSGGLVVPSFMANALSRVHGPINLDALPDPAGLVDPRKLFSADASLLGFSLRDLLANQIPQPQIVSVASAGADAAPEVRMRWSDVGLKTLLPFEANPTSSLTLTSTTSPTASTTTCSLQNIALVLPIGRPQLRLRVATVLFEQKGSAPPRLELRGVGVEFLNELQLLQQLGDAAGLAGAGPAVAASSTEITARYRVPLPVVSAGAFTLRNIVFGAGITVPLDGRSPSVSLTFARREEPFALAVLMFGGGGYIEIDLDPSGLRRVEASLEFGALVSLDFVVARAEVHALGGVRYLLALDGSVSLSGYLRIGGCLDVLGLISVAVELCVTLNYNSDTKALVGRATLVIDIDLTLWSQSVELDSGEWVLAGGRGSTDSGERLARPRDVPRPGLRAGGDPQQASRDQWRAYRAAFAMPPAIGSPDRA